MAQIGFLQSKEEAYTKINPEYLNYDPVVTTQKRIYMILQR